MTTTKPRSRSMLWRFLPYIRPHRGILLWSVAATVLFVLLSALQIWLIGPLVGSMFGHSPTDPTSQAVENLSGGGIDQVFSGVRQSFQELLQQFVVVGNPTETLARLCLAILLISLLKAIFGYIQSFTVALTQQRIIRLLRDQMFAHYHDLSLAYFTRTRTGQVISRVGNDVRILNDMLDLALGRLFRDPLLVMVLLISLLVLNWRLTLLAGLVLPISVGLMTLVWRYIRRYSRRAQERMGDISSILEESIGGVRVVKAFGREDHEKGRFSEANRGYYRAMVKMARARLASSPLNEFLGTAAGVIILWFGGRAVLDGTGFQPGEFMTYVLLVFSMIQPVKALANVHSRLAEGEAAAERVFEALDTPVEVQDNPGAHPLTRFTDDIRYDKVSFHYGNELVLRDIDLTIKRGQSVALVGPSGGGKSTLCDLLARFYDPIEGAITIDGVDIRHVTTKSLRDHLGVVTQDVILFYDTVARNIAYGYDPIDHDRLRRAADAAYALEFIEALPEKWDTVIGPRGVKLSGGQRQRLAIARAIFKDPPILIFDEATSALDTESEFAVQRAIDNLLQDRTALIVAHRLSTVRRADLIVVIDKGQIAERGAHDELIAQDGVYRRLYNLQFAEPTPAPEEPDRAPSVL